MTKKKKKKTFFFLYKKYWIYDIYVMFVIDAFDIIKI